MGNNNKKRKRKKKILDKFCAAEAEIVTAVSVGEQFRIKSSGRVNWRRMMDAEISELLTARSTLHGTNLNQQTQFLHCRGHISGEKFTGSDSVSISNKTARVVVLLGLTPGTLENAYI
ncbi:hypothetical protein OWV82_014121 [Melia azedarach]|uniref:Uncharacterized protein n=1 Tax=Melia azedarach TaxID=155640 RepID=A0ACC1XN88_MELAZ|nr:hypothetical protein OWV82_014121 [Melia azedarach]